jgi:hypothetical protein
MLTRKELEALTLGASPPACRRASAIRELLKRGLPRKDLRVADGELKSRDFGVAGGHQQSRGPK